MENQTVSWFIYLEGEIIGPVTGPIIMLLLRQHRLQFADYVWRTELPDWVRVSELPEFSGMMPLKPSVLPPNDGLPKVNLESVRRPPHRVRRFNRVPIQGLVTVSNFGQFSAIDISEGGVAFHTSHPIAPGTELTLKIESPSFARIMENIQGIVVRCSEGGGKTVVAVEFQDLDPGYRRSIDVYIKFKLAAA